MEVGHLKDGDKKENEGVFLAGETEAKKRNECKKKRNK